MAITLSNIRKWIKKITKTSVDYVKQDVGKAYSFETVKGYYNDLTLKVTKDKKHFSLDYVFSPVKINGIEEYPAIEIFQYGLGLYDLYLLTKEEDYLSKFLKYVTWAVENQNANGSWITFYGYGQEHSHSSMAQGEGASLLIRGYIETGNKKYLEAAKRAIDFMITPISDGGTAIHEKDSIILLEYTCFPFVFNGWIFSIFGLIDYCCLTKDSFYQSVLSKTLQSFKDNVNKMDNGYWTTYRNDKTIASSFYHNLHIALLKVLYDFTKDEIYKEYYLKFEKYRSNIFKRMRAFFKKLFQKVFSKG